jgi:hypothetical protein
MDGIVSAGLPQSRALARRSRNVFAMALASCAILALDITSLRHGPGGPAAGFGPLMFWSLAAAAYAFHSLASTNRRLLDEMGSRMVWDRMKGLKQLAAIKARLRDESAPQSESDTDA